MYTLYGIKNCDTVKKARQWLDQNSVTYRFHDFRSDGLTPALMANFVARSDWNLLLNRSSISWRQLNTAQKADLTEHKAVELMLNTPTLIKRPILDTGDKLIFGFITRDGVYAGSPPGAGSAITRDGVYAGSSPGAGSAIAKDGVYAANLPGAGAAIARENEYAKNLPEANSAKTDTYKTAL
jgi:arsenate reductase